MSDEIWTQKDGTGIKVDDMSESHVRNSFKLLIRRVNAHNLRNAQMRDLETFIIEADWAHEFNE